jgi:hypothetical protein
LMARGAGAAAYDDIFRYGTALATDTLPEPNAPSGVVRWITGNADPKGRLPWPFGTTNYLVWWGSASWPFWLVSIPALAHLLLAPYTTLERRLVAAWTLAAWAQVTLPGLYWPHYYLLPIAGAAITVAVCCVDVASLLGHAIREKTHHARRSILRATVTFSFLTLGICATLFLEVRDYLWVPPQELTIRYKGGQQWVVLREMGGEMARRCAMADDSRLYIWGWQSPLHFYGHMDSPTRHFFVDNLLRDQADRDHALIRPRTEEIMASLERRPPELIFTGYPPFRALKAFLNERYLPSRMAPGLWVRQEDYDRFERAGAKTISGGVKKA